MHDSAFSKLKVGLVFVLSAVAVGTIGFMLLEKWDFIDSLYMTIITITTTGFREVHPISDTGKIFTIFVILLGVSSIAYTGGRAVQVLFETQIFRRRKMSKKLQELKNHYIVCGYGRMGKYICEVLVDEKVPFVVVENSPAKVEKLIERGYVFINGDSTSDETLIEAGIKNAKGMVAVLSNDADNVFAILSAKQLNPDIFIVSRAVEEETESKLIKAGANRVVKPYEAGGTRMASLLLRPGVIDFIDVVAREKNVDLNIEEVSITQSSSLKEKTLAESPIRKDLNIIIVSVQKKGGKFIYNPLSSTKLEEGDKLIALGEESNLRKLQNLCES